MANREYYDMIILEEKIRAANCTGGCRRLYGGTGSSLLRRGQTRSREPVTKKSIIDLTLETISCQRFSAVASRVLQ